MTRGGKRPNAGRPKIGKKSTKLTVYDETRACIKTIAAEFDITVSELMEKIVEDKDVFKSFVKKVLTK